MILLPDKKTIRNNYSFDSEVAIPANQESDLQVFYKNFYLKPDELNPETILVARRFFQRHVSNIVYYNRKIKKGRQIYWAIVFCSILVAVVAPAAAFWMANLGGSASGPAVAVATIGAILSGLLAGWKLIQSLVLAHLRLNEWRRTAQKLRSELYRIEGKRRATVERKAREAGTHVSSAELDQAAKLTSDEEAGLRDELQGAITTAEAALEAEVEAHFAAIYDANKLTAFGTSIPTSLNVLERTFEGVVARRSDDAKKRGEADSADRRLERLEKTRVERANEYQEALKEEIALTVDGKPWENGETKLKDGVELGELMLKSRRRKRLWSELEAIEAEWQVQRKAQRERAF
jgi:hypothetical protein